ncbi:hypothetical protein [Halosimplex marinum]|uniref:hypothetical protein n=1 Tax=Halosimplex marinum TaxID=3396620 RepID=UPI003F54C051
MENEDTPPKSVQTTVELVGEFDDIEEILGRSDSGVDELEPVTADLVALLEIVDRTGGATKSQIAEAAAGEVAAEFDADSVIHALRLLAQYDLVALDGNTWRPGPALSME